MGQSSYRPPNRPRIVGPSPQTPGEYRKRHGCLTIWLVLYIIVGLFSIVPLLGITVDMATIRPAPLVYLSIAVLIGELICVVGIFRWKKWGVYGFLILQTVGIVLRLSTGLFTLRSIVAVAIGYIMIFTFATPNLSDYE